LAANETAALQAASLALTNEINNEVTRATAAEATLTTGLSNEVAARTAADTQIRSDINANIFTFQSGVSATTHVVAHNLNADFVDFTVLTQGADGVYRNDIVCVEETNGNTLTVYLSDASKVKVAVQAIKSI